MAFELEKMKTFEIHMNSDRECSYQALKIRSQEICILCVLIGIIKIEMCISFQK